MKAALDVDAVSSLLEERSQAIVIPRFRRLAHGDVEEKAPGDLVTIADREMEAALQGRLERLLPRARVVGEEACASDASLLADLDDGWVWLVDPIDGTRNFAAGSEDFAVMVALLRRGDPIAAWIYAPIADQLAVAEAGAGAFLGGNILRVGPEPDPHLPGVVGRYTPEPLRSVLIGGLGEASVAEGAGAAGLEYPALVNGAWSFLFYWRTKPWDHAPGTLILREAGGYAARPDGHPYRPADSVSGLLAAPNREMWRGAQVRLPAEITTPGQARLHSGRVSHT